jgi:hypothetical protein
MKEPIYGRGSHDRRYRLSPVAVSGHRHPQVDAILPLLQERHGVAEIDAMRLPTDGGVLFVMALAFLVVAAALTWIERPKGA